MKEKGQIEVPKSIDLEANWYFYDQQTSVTVHTDATYITMEHTSNGDLFEVIKNTGGLKNLELTRYLFS